MTVPALPKRPSAWQAWGRHVVLFLLTGVMMLLVPSGGIGLLVGALSIMLAHEFGHYFACRYYNVDATLPFFIPFPSLVGTLGAFIRIRSPFPHRRALFDIGIAGPLAGFVVTLPVLIFGLYGAYYIPDIDTQGGGGLLGDPLLLQWLAHLFLGPAPEGMTLVIGPMGLAGWFGLFMTGLNLLPIGQLDGGHVVYALMGRRLAAIVSRLGFFACVALIYFGPNWLIWSVLLLLLGRGHPRTLDDHEPVGDGRVVVGLIGLVVFIVCFVPEVIVGSWQVIWQLVHPH